MPFGRAWRANLPRGKEDNKDHLRRQVVFFSHSSLGFVRKLVYIRISRTDDTGLPHGTAMIQTEGVVLYRWGRITPTVNMEEEMGREEDPARDRRQ